MAGTPPNTFTDATSGQAALYALLANHVDIYSKVDPDGAKGGYADLPARLAGIEADLISAGDGDAKVRTGTNAQRLAYTTPSDGLIWVETDTGEIYRFDLAGGVWIQVASFNADGTLTVAAPTGDTHAATKGYADAAVDEAVFERPFSVDSWAPDPDYPPASDENGYGVLFPGDAEARMKSILSGMDTGKDFTFELHAALVDASAGNAKFSLDYRATSDAGNLDTAAWTNIGTVTLALSATAYQKTSGTFGGSLEAAGIAAGDLVQLRLARNPDDAADTAGDAVTVKLRVIPATPE